MMEVMRVGGRRKIGKSMEDTQPEDKELSMRCYKNIYHLSSLHARF
jgi:hypothetical protein